MRILPALLLILAATPALAQFPPPGAYACTDAAGASLGQLFLVPDGDYEWTPVGGEIAKGQMASASTSVRALTGVLFDDYHLTGFFKTDDAGDTTFAFTSDKGAVNCAPPPL